jgi:hypothetical protein
VPRFYWTLGTAETARGISQAAGIARMARFPEGPISRGR